MAKKNPPAASTSKPVDNTKVICENRKARHEYEVLETLECGMILLGSEVKSLRSGKVMLDDAYGRVKDDGTLWLIGCEIPEYSKASIWNHPPKRPRELLVRKREMLKFAQRAKEKGLTLVPMRLYFNARGIAKVLLALCKGRKLFDKREVLKTKDVKRDIDRAMKRR
ncbi:MAG TPA: SsrA-binding protein SmpB [Pirellulaceae bacterium]|nr:SsrA-binding protein SmpB [Pirellulaceae bacterium]